MRHFLRKKNESGEMKKNPNYASYSGDDKNIRSNGEIYKR